MRTSTTWELRVDGSTVAEIIGETCDHRACSAPPAVVAGLLTGELRFCGHHWRAAQERVTALPSFVALFDSPLAGRV